VARWLAYGHPAWMVVALCLAALALRAGMRLRAQRQGRGVRALQPRAELLRAHLRLAKPAVVLVLLGFVAGPLSAVWLRGWSPFGKLHAWLGLAAALLFGTVAWLGHRLQAGRGGRPDTHGWLALLALLMGALAAVAGFVLLP
jgi:hypothetical protein